MVYSGGTSGIMVQLEEALGQRFLHLYCRHHVYERYKSSHFCFKSDHLEIELTSTVKITNYYYLLNEAYYIFLILDQSIICAHLSDSLMHPPRSYWGLPLALK